MNVFSFIYRSCRKIWYIVVTKVMQPIAYLKLLGNGVKFDSTLICNGIPIVDIDKKGVCIIGHNCKINSNIIFNPIGRYTPTVLIVRENALLTIGCNTGISSSAIVCHKEIRIGDRVKLGGNVAIYDTDFHSLNYSYREDGSQDHLQTVSKKVVIEDDVFVGAHTTILKGVSIGKRSIIGACSVVTKDVPPDEIWAGNPAKLVKKIVQ